MIKEIRKLPMSKGKYIRALQYKGKIKVYFNSKGYVCYDTQELKEFQSNNKKGRPPKIKGQIINE